MPAHHLSAPAVGPSQEELDLLADLSEEEHSALSWSGLELDGSAVEAAAITFHVAV